MSMHHSLATGPLKDGETSVLGCDKGNSIMLILNELCRREVPGTAELFRMDEVSDSTIDRFRDGHLLHLCPTPTAGNLRPKTEQFMLIGEYDSAVNRSQSGDRVHGPAECLQPGLPTCSIGVL